MTRNGFVLNGDFGMLRDFTEQVFLFDQPHTQRAIRANRYPKDNTKYAPSYGGQIQSKSPDAQRGTRAPPPQQPANQLPKLSADLQCPCVFKLPPLSEDVEPLAAVLPQVTRRVHPGH